MKILRMPETRICVSRPLHRSAEDVWALARNFSAAWHPAIATCKLEPGSNGGLVRRFTMKGEDTVHVEQQTFFSDSLRRISYHHLQGIVGVASYTAALLINSEGEHAVAEWSATITADEPRLTQIAKGTRQVFECGLLALATALPTLHYPTPDIADPIQLRTLIIPGTPDLSILKTDGSGDTLCLFLHGIGGRKENWASQLQAVAHHFPAAALDLRGYGASSLGKNQSTVVDHFADILRVMAACKAKRLILVGLSFGSWIATSFAVRHLELLAGLVASGGCTGMSEAGIEERQRFLALREAPLKAGKSPRDFASQIVDAIASPGATDQVKQELQASMAAIASETYLDALRCFTNPPEIFDFSKLAMPVLFVTGEHDRLASPTEIRNVAERVHAAVALPNVRFEKLPSAGHVCNIEAPAAYNALLQNFLVSV